MARLQLILIGIIFVEFIRKQLFHFIHQEGTDMYYTIGYVGIFLVNTILMVWLSCEMIKDSCGQDQSWHYVQSYFMVWIIISEGAIVWVNHGNILAYTLVAIGYGFSYMFIFNSLLNLVRGQSIEHLGRYDRFSFEWTLIFFGIGILFTIIGLKC